MVLAPVDPGGAALRALRSAGLRVTMPRRAILAWLAMQPHSTADAIGTGVREHFVAVSTQAVYDMLAAGTAAGLAAAHRACRALSPVRAPGR